MVSLTPSRSSLPVSEVEFAPSLRNVAVRHHNAGSTTVPVSLTTRNVRQINQVFVPDAPEVLEIMDDEENAVDENADLIEAFANQLPEQTGEIRDFEDEAFHHEIPEAIASWRETIREITEGAEDGEEIEEPDFNGMSTDAFNKMTQTFRNYVRIATVQTDEAKQSIRDEVGLLMEFMGPSIAKLFVRSYNEYEFSDENILLTAIVMGNYATATIEDQEERLNDCLSSLEQYVRAPTHASRAAFMDKFWLNILFYDCQGQLRYSDSPAAGNRSTLASASSTVSVSSAVFQSVQIVGGASLPIISATAGPVAAGAVAGGLCLTKIMEWICHAIFG